MASEIVDGDVSRGEALHGPRPRKRLRWRWMAGLAAIVAIAGGLTLLVQFWQERPLRHAQRELEQGDARRALSLVDYFLDRHADHGRALALKARALCALGRAAESIELYERVGAATGADVHAWARAYLTIQAWSRAVRLLEQVVRMEPDNVDALYEVTTCRLQLGLLEEALESARRFSELPGQEAKGAVMLATIHNDLRNADETLRYYQRAAELAPEGKGLQIPPEELFLQYGSVFVTQGKAEQAVPWLEKSLATRPTPAAVFFLGNAYSQLGQTDKAEQAWQKAVEIDPASVSSREALANLAMTKGDLDTALKWLSPLQRVAENRADTAYLFQRLYSLRKDEAAFKQWQEKTSQLRERDQRMSALDRMMQGAPYSFWANVVRAYRFATLGNWRQAEDMLDALVERAPEMEFVVELREAVRKRGPLPSLDRVPLKRF